MMKWLLIFSCVVAVAYAIPWDTVTELDTYVHADDGFFSWDILDQRPFNRCSSFVINMTSQKWMDETFVDRPVWFHYMQVLVPDEDLYIDKDFGFLLIGGGDNDDSPPDAEDATAGLLCAAARDIGAMTGILFQSPNQPLHFLNDPTYRRRTEDRVIAWTWRTYIDEMRNTGNPDPTVILRFPMTKGAKRALDTMNELGQQQNSGQVVDRFGVAGGSKRGWTTWSLAATDQRVKIMLPLVFSMLNMEPAVMAHFRSLDGWSFAFEPYHAENLTQEMKTPEAFSCDQNPPGGMCYEDMYYYFERLTMPKIQLVSTGDEFFLLTDSHQWWDDLPQPKWTYMLENSEHSMAPWYVKLYEILTASVQSYLWGVAMPQTSWTFEYFPGSGGRINFTVSPPPVEVRAWRAVTLANDTLRDFRLAGLNEFGEVEIHPVRWDEENIILTDQGNGLWTAETNEEIGEWVGMTMHGEWLGPTGQRLILGTETIVLPDTYPVEECTDGDSCYGVLR